MNSLPITSILLLFGMTIFDDDNFNMLHQKKLFCSERIKLSHSLN